MIIAGAGMSAALPGVAAAHTDLPVIGVPILGKSLGGLDALLTAVQMPPGVPVACVAIDGAKNAGLLAARIIHAVIARYTRERDRRRLDRTSAGCAAGSRSSSPPPTPGPPQGKVPAEAAAACRERAAFTVEAVKERERETNHDVAAFVDVVAASIGEQGRWIHYGLTSSDVLDTALALQLVEAGLILVSGATAYRDALVAKAREHAETLCVGRTHGVHAEPTTFGLRLAGLRLRGRPQPDPPARGLRRRPRSASSRARSAPTPRPRPRSRRAVMDELGLRAEDDLHPGRPPRPPRRGAERDRARRRRARALRPGDPQPPAHRGARGRGAVRLRRAEGLLGDAAQAQPDHLRAHQRARAGAARLRAGRARERRPLARARHLPLGRRAGDPARRDDPARLHAAPRRCAWSRG